PPVQRGAARVDGSPVDAVCGRGKLEQPGPALRHEVLTDLRDDAGAAVEQVLGGELQEAVERRKVSVRVHRRAAAARRAINGLQAGQRGTFKTRRVVSDGTSVWISTS